MGSEGYEAIKTNMMNEKEESDDHVNGHSRNKCVRDVEMAFQLCDSSPSSLRQSTTKLIVNGKTRLVSLDVFRGLTVLVMLFVDHAGRIFPMVNHSPWDGLSLADFVFPFFLFMVGLSLALAFKKLSCRVVASVKAILRALKLLALGVFLQGGFFHGVHDLTYGVDIKQIRWMGILQRIALAYLVTALCEIWLKSDDDDDIVNSGLSILRKYQYQGVVIVLLTSIYLGLLYGLYVPDWEYQVLVVEPPKTYSVKCGVRGNTGPACNAVGMVDRKILGIQHLYKRPIYSRTHECSTNSPDYGPRPSNAPSWCQAPFDPEGILSSMMAIVTCLVGLHYGHIIVYFKDHKVRMFQWMIPSVCLVIVGLALNLFGMHINKPLYTLSYMCVTTGAAGVLFVGIYFMVDVCGYNRITVVLEWMGMHALIIFIVAACNIVPIILQGFYSGTPDNNIVERRELSWWWCRLAYASFLEVDFFFLGMVFGVSLRLILVWIAYLEITCEALNENFFHPQDSNTIPYLIKRQQVADYLC